MKSPGALRRRGLPVQPLPPENGDVQLSAVKRHRYRMLNVSALRGQRLQRAGGLALIAKRCWRAAKRGSHRVKQPPAGRGQRGIDAALNGARQDIPVLLLQPRCLRVILPVRHKAQALRQQIYATDVWQPDRLPAAPRRVNHLNVRIRDN
ncbi:Uncharacterised protein [Salmonella sp. NCTC 11881]|nr:Uncharacterised protein [Salmonella sp. NCTC 11881]